MAKYDWKPIEKSLKKTIPACTVKIQDKSDSALVFSHSALLAVIMYLPKTEDLGAGIGISLRASCPPVEAGVISAVCASHSPIEFDEYFEFDRTGQKVYGPAALHLAWSRSSDFVSPSDKDKFMDNQISQPN